MRFCALQRLRPAAAASARSTTPNLPAPAGFLALLAPSSPPRALPALFHAGSARGLHPSELSPLKQPAHLSMTRALLTLTRHRLHQRPARSPLLNIELTTIPLQQHRPRVFHRSGPKPEPPSATVLHRRRLARGPGSARSTPAVSSGEPARRLPGTEAPFQQPTGRLAASGPRPPRHLSRRRSHAASSAFHGSTLALETFDHDPKVAASGPPTAASTASPRGSRLRDRSAASANAREHSRPRPKLTLRPAVRQDRLPPMSTSSF
jgi:hypothetical protein